MADFLDDIFDDEDEEIVVLHNEVTDEDEEYYLLAVLDVDKKWYGVMQPVKELDDMKDMLLILEIVDVENGEHNFAPVTDDATLNKVYEEFLKEVEKIDPTDGE